MKIGFSKIDITPPTGITMCGQLQAPESKGAESPLYATCLCIEDNHVKMALLSCDLLMITNEFAKEINEASPVKVIIGATHTHSGPSTVNIFGGKANESYLKDLKNNVLKSIKEAFENRTEADLFYSKDLLKGWAFNRRFIMSDGTIETHPLKKNPHIIDKEGPDSEDLHVLWAENKDGKISGGAIIFGCHGTVMERSNQFISSDFPGQCAEYLAGKFNAPFLYLQSACGNIGQVDSLESSKYEIGKEWAQKMGVAIGKKAESNIRRGGIQLKSPRNIKSKIVKISRRKIPSELLQWAGRHENDRFPIPELSNYGAEKYNELLDGKASLEAIFRSRFWAGFYANEIKTKERDCSKEPRMPFNISMMNFGKNLAIVALPCELFVEWQNQIIRESPFENTIVIELANGWNGYVPTEKAFLRRGGYETKEVTSSILVPEAGNMICEKVKEMFFKQGFQ